MSVAQVVVHGRVLPDGTLELDQPLGLPPGEVRVTIKPVPSGAGARDPHQADLSGAAPGAGQSRSLGECDTALNQVRAEAEERMRAIQQIHDECDPSSLQGGSSGASHTLRSDPA